MCGIVGIAGTRDVAPVILEALKRLEYRGYDSAGIATLQDGKIARRRSPGKLNNLGAVLDHKPLAGHTGIGHTRWATHGAPTESNAHPHATGSVSAFRVLSICWMGTPVAMKRSPSRSARGER